MLITLQRIAAFVLLFVSCVEIAIAAPISSTAGRTPAVNSIGNMPSFQTSNTYPPVDVPANLALASEQFGLTGPLSVGLNYSDLTGTYVTAHYLKKMSDTWAFGLIGEYGTGQYRVNGTVGFKLGAQSLFKVTGERFNQRLPFAFDSGPIYERVSQDAVGARYQQVLSDNGILRALDFGAYHAVAHNVGLSSVIYTANGMNCLGAANGMQCINDRNIAGGISTGGDLGFTALVTSKTLIQARLNYDELYYNTIYSLNSSYNRRGFGTTINMEQLLAPRLRFVGGVEFRAIYNSFNAALSWLTPFIASARTEVSIFAQRVVSKNLTPDNNTIGLKLNFLGDVDNFKNQEYQINPTAFLADISSWVREPAVKMNQVLAVAEQMIRLLAASIQSISPSIGPLSGGNEIIITGINFSDDAIVLIDNQIALTTFLSPSKLSAIIPHASPQVMGRSELTHKPVPVNVMLKCRQGMTTLADSYDYSTDAVGPPRILTITPNQGSIAGNTLITITGQNFGGATSVTVGGISAEIVSNTDTEIVVVTPAHGAGVAAVVVTTAMGSYTFPGGFTYSAELPTITSITPNVGSVNGHTSTIISGTNLSGITSVNFGNNAAISFTVNSATSITAITPIYSSGPLAVNVTVGDGVSNATIAPGFTYQMGSPIISSLSPHDGSVAGGTVLTLQGSGFSPSTQVTIGIAPATTVEVVSSTILLATTPAYVSGSLTKDVTVNNGEGSATLMGGFTYIASTPRFLNLTPISGSTAGGTTVTITGSNFIPGGGPLPSGTTVSFDGLPATDIQVINETTLTAVTPTHAIGPVDVVINNGVGSATRTNAYTYTANAPTLTSINPAMDSVAGGAEVILTGTDLTGINSVTIGGVPASQVTVLSDTSVKAVVPAYVNGPLVVDVIASNGSTNATLAGAFTYGALAPTISSISPSSSSVAGGILATVSGTNFTPGTLVQIGSVAATQITVVDAHTITLTIPPYASGSLQKDVVVNNGINTATLALGFTYNVNDPTLNRIDPPTGSIAGGTSVTFTGTGFTPGTLVTFGGVSAASVFVNNSTTLTAVTPVYTGGALAVDVGVNNGVSNAILIQAFTYQAIAPTALNMTPNTGPVTGGTSVTVNGSGFVPGTTLSIGGVLATDIHIINATQLTAKVPPYVGGALVKDVSVTNSAGSAILAIGFTYIESAPTLSLISPDSGAIAGGTLVTLTGTGFTPDTAVTFGGNPATSIVLVNATTLTVLTPAYTGGPLKLDVVVDNGAGVVTLTGGFTYQASVPTIAGITPNTGSINGGTSFVITGSGFVPGTTVKIGGITATSISITNTTTLTAVTPTYVSGALMQDVAVDNGEGSVTLAGGFTYVATAPALMSVAPSSGSTLGGTTITLNGTGFVPGTTVTLDGVPATNVQVLNNTTLTAMTPAHAIGPVMVLVDNLVGTATLANAFTYTTTAPSLTIIDPQSGSVAGGTPITLTGTHLTGVDSVTIGGIAASGVSVVNDNTVNAIVPAYVTGPLVADVTVSNGSSNATLINGFTYLPLAPTIASIILNKSSVAGGITVTLTGTNFAPGTLVMIGGVTASNIQVVNSSTITVTVPAYVSGPLIKDVTVNNGVGIAVLPAGFTYEPVAPTINTVLPPTGPLAGGTFIVVSGSGFTPSTTVTVGGIPASNIMVNNANVLIATTPAYVSGPLTVNVEVSNSASNAVLSGAFTYQSLSPTLESITPNSGTAAGGTLVTVTGSGFVPGSTLSIGGVPATDITISNVHTLTATIPAYLSGTLIKDVTISNSIGSATLPGGYTYNVNAPTLTNIMPNSGSILGGTMVTLTGSGFTPDTLITVGGVEATSISFVNSTSMSAFVPAYESGPLVADVVVKNSVSNAVLTGGFLYQASPPTITTVTPNSGTVNGGTTVIINGAGFVPGTTVTIGGVAATSVTITNATTLTAKTPIYISGPLIKDVMVNNSAGNFVLHGGFIYITNTPTLSNLDPTSGSTDGGTTVTLTGSNFIPSITLTFDGIAATDIQVINATTLKAVTPAHVSGVVSVVVNNGVGSATLSNAYTYIINAPTLTSIDPTMGSVAGVMPITLTGTNLIGTNAVTFGGIVATGVVVVNSTTVTAVVPAYVSGSLIVDVVASNGTTNATLAKGFTYEAIAPSIIGISPRSSSITGGIRATVSGANFVPGTTVQIGGIAATNITVVNANTITLSVPAYVNGSLSKDVVVNNGVSSATLTDGFKYAVGAPTLSGVSPAKGSIAGGTLITLTGTGFTPTTAVTLGGISVTDVSVSSSTTLTAVTPAYVSGALAVDVGVDNGESNVTLPQAFTYQAIAPTALNIAPNSGTVAGGTFVTVMGSGFVPGTTLNIGDVLATNIQLINATQLTATIPPYVSGALAKDVTVNNSMGSATVVAGFTYVESAPTLTNITPKAGAITGGTQVTLTGTNFSPTTTVMLGGNPATSITVINATTLTAVTPAYGSGALIVDVVVDNGAGNATLVGGFTYKSGAPTLSNIDPNSGSINGGTSITLTGSGFMAGTTVTIGGVTASVVLTDTTTLTAVTPAYVSGSLITDVTVSNGAGSVTLAGGFTYIADAPTLGNIAPTSGSILGGTTITLTGTAFVPGTTVTLDGVAATNIQVLNSTTLTTVTPAHASGTVDVTVDNLTGTSTLAGAFTYAAIAPSLSSINPVTGSVAGGTAITLTGANLLGITSVTIGGVAASNVSVLDDSHVIAVVPAYVSGPLAADVTVSDGTLNATLVKGFTYQAIVPSIISLSPNTSSVAGGITATVTGTDFVPGTTVLIGGITASNINIVNINTITLTIPPYVSGSLIKDVVVDNGVDTATLAAGFIYTPVAPTLAAIAPSTGPLAGGTVVTLTGTGFTRSTNVLIGGYSASGILVLNATTLTAITPAYINGPLAADVTVVNGVSNAVLPSGFVYVAAPPTLASITPDMGSVDGGTLLTVTGTNFTPTTTLGIGSIPATQITVLNSTTLLATTPAYVDGALIKSVTIDNGEGSTTLPDGYTYTPNSPTLTDSVPSKGSTSGGTVVTLTGTNFTPTSTVTFGGIPATNIVVTSATSLTAITPVYVGGSLAVDIVVNNGVSNAVLIAAFTYEAANPTLTAVNPNTGSVNGGTAVILTGSNFTPTTTVTVGGSVATSVVVVSATTLTAVVPAYVSGSLVADVAVNNGVASAILSGGFTYTAVAPVLVSIAPGSGSTLGGTTITLTGNGFLPGTTVTVGGIAATNVQMISATKLTAVTSAHAPGLVSVMVDNGVSSVTLNNAFTYVEGAPTLSSASPDSGSVIGGISITLTGENLTGITSVMVGGQNATQVQAMSDTEVTATLPAYVSGPLLVDVTVSDGQANATLSNAFIYTPVAPTLSFLSSSSGSTAGGTFVTVTGTGFVPGTTVTIGGVLANNINVINQTTLTLSTPIYVNGPLATDVVATNTAGSSNSLTYTYTPIAPTLTSVVPNFGPVGGNTAIVLTGTGFVPGTSVTIGGKPALSVSVINSTTIFAITPAYVSGPLAADVIVANMGESNGVLSGGFTYLTATPTLAGIAPDSGSMAGGTMVTIQGTNFTPTTTLSIGGVAATGVNVLNATTLTAITPAYFSGSLVSDVVVTNAAGSATLSGGYTYLAVAPALTNVNPATGSIVGGTTITLTGTGFTPTTTVTIGGIAATSILVSNATTLTAVTPAYESGSLAVDVVVNNGEANASIIGGFRYLASVPSITALSPASGTVLGGTPVTITGSNFIPGTTVTIGGIAASSISVTNASTLVITTPAYISGSLIKDVVVTNSAGSTTLSGGFTYLPVAPTLTSITPNLGSIFGGTVTTITGTNFTPTTTVTIGGVAATSVLVTSATSATVVTPAYVNGPLAADVVVTNSVSSATLTGGFTYQAVAPTIGSITPNSGPVMGGTVVMITGTSFTPETTVSIGGIMVESVSFVNATTLTVLTPVYMSGSLIADVVVNNRVSTANLTGGFTYTAVTPVITSVLPLNGSIAGGTTITLTGSGFIPDMGVTLDGIPATGVHVINAKKLTAVTPAHASGAVDVVASNTAGSVTLTNGFTYITLAPILSGVSPSSGSVSSITNITLTGVNLTGITSVTVGGVVTTELNVVNDTTVTATVPIYVSGPLLVDVTASNPSANATLSNAFTYVPVAPTIGSLMPNTGTIAGGTPVILTGTGFIPGTTVTIGDQAANNVVVVNASTLMFSTPVYDSGSLIKNVVVTNSVNSTTLINGFTYTAIAPTLASINPNTGSTAGNIGVTLTGTGFTPTTTVTIGGQPATGVLVTSATSLTATVPAYLSGPLAADVIVNNGKSNAILSGGFTYQASAPTISSITPGSGSAAGGTVVTVSGTDFTPSTTLTIGGVAATSIQVVNATTVTAVTPAYFDGSLAKNVVINNGVSSATLSNGYTYLAVAPTLSNVSPNVGPTVGNTLITITGTGFTPTTKVMVGGISTPLPVTFVNATQITAFTPAYISGALAKDVVVTNDAASATLTAGFTYQASAPTLTSILPDTGSTTGGTSVTLTGTNFTPATTVTIGGLTATNIIVVNATTITAATPAYISGPLAADVVIYNGVSSATLTGGFNYIADAPTLTNLNPNAGPVAGGTVVTIMGMNFTPTMTVSIAGFPATAVTVVNATTLKATTPAYVSGSLAADVVVDNGVSNAVLTGGFTYQPAAPTIGTILPNGGSMVGGALVTVTGANFTPTTSLSIGGQAATSVMFVNATTLTAVTPAYISGALAKDVVVTNSVGSATLTAGYTYIAAVPTLIAVSPNSGPISGGTNITVSGSSFTPATIVTIGGIPVTAVTVMNSTTLIASTPAYVSGALVKNVIVNNGVGSATLSNGFTYIAVAPTVVSVSPNIGPTAGGTGITVRGTGFTPSTTLTIDGFAATSIEVTNATTLMAVTPAYVSGPLAANVVVTNEIASATLTGGFTYQASAPTLISITPAAGSVIGGTAVSLLGTNFTPATTVTIGGIAATNISFTDTTTLTATIPAYVSDSLQKDVVINNGVSSATLTGGFTYVPIVPSLGSILPNTGAVTGNTNITLSGTGFTPGTVVTIGGITATNIVVVNATTITASTPAYTSGALTVDVAVNNGSGNAILAGGFTYTAITPALSSVLPSNGTIAGNTKITLTGTGFVPGTSVTLDGVPATGVVVVNSTTLTAFTPSHASGPVDVVVSNTAGSATLSNGFTYVTLTPTLTVISPISGSVTGGTSITLTGLNLTGITNVTVGGQAASNVVVVDDSTITAIVPAYVSGSLLVDVTVTNVPASVNATLSGAFTYQPVAPTILSLLPGFGSMAGGTSVTLNGTGFIPGTTVTIGGQPAINVIVVNATTITLSTPAYVSGALYADVVVTNSVTSTTLSGGFHYIAIAPTLVSISPNFGPIAGNTIVILTGTGFTPTTTVYFGSQQATIITRTSASNLTVTTPAYVSGPLAVNVSVVNEVSNAVLTNGFTYQAVAPTLTSIAPINGSMAGGTAVTLSGTNFTPGTTLTIGSIAATSINVVNVTSMTAVIPAYVSGSLAKNVVINNSVGSATLANGYTYLAVAPTLSNVTPNTGPTAGGTPIVITGTGFTPTTTVTVGGIAATSVNVVNATTLSAVTPAYVSGSLTKDVTINNGNSNATLSNSFIYVAPAPTLLNIAPTSGPTSGGTSITLTGTSFIPGTTVTIGGIAVTNVVIINATTLTATTPAYVSGSLVKTVAVNNGIAAASLLNAFTYTASAPTISSITPNTGTSSGGTSVTISGSNFIPGTTVTIGGIATTGTTVVNATTITAVTPAYVTGSLTVNVAVNNTISTATLTNGYTYIAVVPSVASCSYPGGLLSSAWVCVGTNMNVFPNTYINVQGGLLCSLGVGISALVTTISTALNLGGNTLLPALYLNCNIQICNNSNCLGLTSNVVVFT